MLDEVSVITLRGYCDAFRETLPADDPATQMQRRVTRRKALTELDGFVLLMLEELASAVYPQTDDLDERIFDRVTTAKLFVALSKESNKQAAIFSAYAEGLADQLDAEDVARRINEADDDIDA